MQFKEKIESIGRVADTKPQSNCNFKKFETELMLDWNGPTGPKSQSFIEKSLNRHFGSRKNWRFKSGSSKYFVSQLFIIPQLCVINRELKIYAFFVAI